MTLIDRILRQNPWWQDKKIEGISGFKPRFLFKEIEKYFDDPQMIAILGLRRTGKSVLLLQIIERLLSEVAPKRILYFSFDEILGKDPEIIEKMLETYENEVLKEDLKNVYVFLDEVNHLENWQVVLKRYYDLNAKIKFFVTGSSSVFLKKTKESLAGRIYEFQLFPLDFNEYLYLKDIPVRDLEVERLTLKKELNRYFISGSLPEIILETDFAKVKKYVNSIIDKVIFYDIPKVYDVSQPELLKAILTLIAQRPGLTLEYQSVASSLRVAYQTVSKYVDYLEKSFLAKLVYNFRGSPIAQGRKLKKAYLGAINLASGFYDDENEQLGKLPQLAENLVGLYLRAGWFWKKNTEIDFYHQKLPVEVKYTESSPDIKNVVLAAKSLKAGKILVVTKDIEKKETRNGIEVVFCPLWKFLLTGVPV